MLIVQTGVRADRVTLESYDGDTSKVHLNHGAVLDLILALTGALAYRPTQVVDIAAPEGYEVEEVSEAKTEATDLLHREEGADYLTLGNDIVESLIAMGWRPTFSEEGNKNDK
jgi:hypothetical protein